jgi:hypothetical protein
MSSRFSPVTTRLFSVLLFLLLMVGATSGVSRSIAQGGTTHDAILAQIPDLPDLAKQAEKTFVGEVEGSYAYIAFVVQGNLVVIYVCDSVGVYPWIKAEVVNGAIRATDAKSKVEIIATVTANAISGTVALPTDDDGSPIVPHKFTTAPAVPGKTGLARFVERGTVGGWIVTQNGIRGAIRDGSCADYKERYNWGKGQLSLAKDLETRKIYERFMVSVAVDATIAGCGDISAN